MKKIFSGIRALIGRVADLLCPPRCMLCREIMKGKERGLCPKCRSQEAFRLAGTEWKIPHIKRWTAMWQYTGNVRHSLILYKFWRRRLYAGFYAKELAAHLQRWSECYDLITWVPVSPIRKWSRGYDQVELIVRAMTAEVPVVPVLRKRRHNRRQAEIKGKPARLANVRGVYSCVDPERIRGKRVLLVDDIITTGATVSEAANTLRKAGAKEVFAACIAARNHYT